MQHIQMWGWSQQPGCIPLSRKLLRKWLAKVNADHYEENAVLCFTEVLTNAIRIPSPSGLTDTKWILCPDRLRIEVRDYSTEAPYVSPTDLDAESGRGLLLVHLLADKWGYDHCRFLDGKGGYVPGKTVWFELYQ
ncbi:ATP-binding protein [Streptomyces albogriseolus]|jgi:hypothetical protein|uniref:ATP-binding protein n=1 Tax=Streptomyces albogriseolus TaxID=1887 RepID=UPI0036B8788F